MSTSLPFPSGNTTPSDSSSRVSNLDGDMKIDIPKESEKDGHNSTLSHKKHSGGSTGVAAGGGGGGATFQFSKEDSQPTFAVPPRGSSAPNTWVHHPRQPHSGSDSYFPNSGHSAHGSTTSLGPSASSSQPPKTPSGIRSHSRQTSGTSTTGVATTPIATAPPPPPPPAGGTNASNTGTTSRKGGQNMSLSLSAGVVPPNGPSQSQSQSQVAATDHLVGVQGGSFGGGPPSPSTLTDIILGLHSTLYGGKKRPEEVREMVGRYYDYDAVFESPLLSARGREEIANQYIMAFALPGMDVGSELRDVICSDFEFDGTRAGIIDQTISVTFLPSFFGSSSSSSGAYSTPGKYPNGESEFAAEFHKGGSSTPGYVLQSAVTPHPFANYGSGYPQSNAGGSTFSRFGGANSTHPHSPTTPYSLSSLWGGSRPHTPGAPSGHMRPLSSSIPSGSHLHKASTPPSVNGDEDLSMSGYHDASGGASTVTGGHYGEALSSAFVSTTDSAGQQQIATRPSMPSEALVPHWTAQGLGRNSFRAIVWGLFHPRAVLKHLCTINLRLMSRLEFNDAGMIVRHEDTWGVRETIEGTIPFASLIYAIERRVVGFLCSFAIGKGFRLSSALTRTTGSTTGSTRMNGDYDPDASEAARAILLGHGRHLTGPNFHHHHGTIGRSRATSPSRQRFGSLHGGPTPYGLAMSAGGATSTGTRSRARSLIGSTPIRAASSDNLHHLQGGGGESTSANFFGSSTSAYGDRERGTSYGGETLPPDSGARYRKRHDGRTTSTNSAPPSHHGDDNSNGSNQGNSSNWQQSDLYGKDVFFSTSSGDIEKTRAPDRDL